jgi:uncharacterized protein (DUF885 family)
LIGSKMFKKNELEDVFKQINCSPGQALAVFWGIKQFKSLEQACRAKVGPHFSQKEYFHLLLNQGPVAITFIKRELMNRYYLNKTTN